MESQNPFMFQSPPAIGSPLLFSIPPVPSLPSRNRAGPTLTCATGSPEAAAAAAATEAAAAFSKLGALGALGAGALAGTGSWDRDTMQKPWETMGKIVIYADLREKHGFQLQN